MNSWGGGIINVGEEVIFTVGDYLRKGIILKITKKQCVIRNSYIFTDTYGNNHSYHQDFIIRYPSCQVLKLKEDE